MVPKSHHFDFVTWPSMKVPPKRKGNTAPLNSVRPWLTALNESPSEKEGKYHGAGRVRRELSPSMKVPPKRKGNTTARVGSEENSVPQ